MALIPVPYTKAHKNFCCSVWIPALQLSFPCFSSGPMSFLCPVNLCFASLTSVCSYTQPFQLINPSSPASWQAVRTGSVAEKGAETLAVAVLITQCSRTSCFPWASTGGTPGPALARPGRTLPFAWVTQPHVESEKQQQTRVGSSSVCRDNRAAGRAHPHANHAHLCCQHAMLAQETQGSCSRELCER